MKNYLDAAGEKRLRTAIGESNREHAAIAGLILRQPKTAGDPVLHHGERRLCVYTAVAVKNLIRHTILLEHRNVAGGAIQLALRAE